MIGSLLERLLDPSVTGASVAHRACVLATGARHAEPGAGLGDPLRYALEATRVGALYSHQARGLDLARSGRDVLVVTPTASGKTLLFAMCVLESAVADPSSRALLLYPTKALARDQLAGLRDLARGIGALGAPRFEIYDGDTPQALRRKIKADLPNGLLTNPDMLHHGILAHHAEWEPFLRNLRWIVIDEAHVYRGIFGSHVHHILARLLRLCARYGSRPQYVAASATVGNPEAFARTLTGRSFEVVSESGAPRGPLDVVFLNPVAISPYTVAVRVIAEAARAGLRTIAFTKARRVTELLYTWLVQQEPALSTRVAPYRAGYLPEERRALEARLFRGELSAVISTSALELGIDVGGLDVSVLVGYPGSLISSWQRIGRIGRQGRPGLAVLVAMPDALDQYVVHHPDLFFGRGFEKAVLDPWNPLVAGKHLVCAAAEQPLEQSELSSWGDKGRAITDELTRTGELVQDARGTRWFAFRRKPHRGVHPRATGEPYAIVERGSGRLLGQIDGVRVYQECHPGAIYLHAGQSFHVLELDRDRRQVLAEPVRADHYTVVLGDKETRVLERLGERKVGPFPVSFGRLEVTLRIREYQKRRLFGGEPISTHPLEIPPLTFETLGFWIELSPRLPAAYAARALHFMGGIHAAEHAIIGLFPLLAIAERGDVGGISYTGHPQIGGPAIFVYDGVPGGAGLAEQGFADLPQLLGKTLELVRDCPCEQGCPGCIQSPQCGNGNKPLDKEAALLTLRLALGEVSLDSLAIPSAPDPLPAPGPEDPPAPAMATRKHGVRRAGNVDGLAGGAARPATERWIVFDLETQRSAAEVGGFQHASRLGLALAVTYDARPGVYRTYREADVHRLLLDLVMADRVVGFNIDRFDLYVLGAYTDWDLSRIRTLDLLSEIHRQLGFRLSLGHLCEMNLGRAKAADGMQSLRWWKEGRVDLIEQYCRQDVEDTRELYELGRDQRFLLYRDHADRAVRVPVRW